MSIAKFSQNTLMLLGRMAFAQVFVISGFQKILSFSATAAYIASKGLPYSHVLLIIAIIFEFGGGMMVLLGWKTRWGAALLFLFMIPVTYVFHSFWTVESQEVVNQMHHLMKNLAMMGGTLYIMAIGGGAFSFDCRKSNEPTCDSE